MLQTKVIVLKKVPVKAKRHFQEKEILYFDSAVSRICIKNEPGFAFPASLNLQTAPTSSLTSGIGGRKM